MIGVLTNVGAIIIGSLLGVLLHKFITPTLRTAFNTSLGVAVICVAVLDVIKTPNALILTLSVVIGGILGSLIGIHDRLNQFGQFLQRKLTRDDNSTFGEAFTTSTLIYCVGAMVVYGSINAGLGNNDTLYLKSVLDGVVAITLASTLGIGVMLSALPVLIIQGALALCSTALSPYVTQPFVNMLSGIGGCVVLCIGLNFLGVTKIKTADFIPAVLGSLFIFLI